VTEILRWDGESCTSNLLRKFIEGNIVLAQCTEQMYALANEASQHSPKTKKQNNIGQNVNMKWIDRKSWGWEAMLPVPQHWDGQSTSRLSSPTTKKTRQYSNQTGEKEVQQYGNLRNKNARIHNNRNSINASPASPSKPKGKFTKRKADGQSNSTPSKKSKSSNQENKSSKSCSGRKSGHHHTRSHTHTRREHRCISPSPTKSPDVTREPEAKDIVKSAVPPELARSSKVAGKPKLAESPKFQESSESTVFPKPPESPEPTELQESSVQLLENTLSSEVPGAQTDGSSREDGISKKEVIPSVGFLNDEELFDLCSQIELLPAPKRKAVRVIPPRTCVIQLKENLQFIRPICLRFAFHLYH